MLRQVAQGIEDQDVRARRLRIIGSFYGMTGETSIAKTILFDVLHDFLERSGSEEQLRDVISVAYALLGLPNLTNHEIANIQKVLIDLPDKDEKNGGRLGQLIRAQILAGELNEAEYSRKKIVGIERRAEAAQSIATAKAREGNMQDTLRWASGLDHPYSRTRAFLGVANGLLKNRENKL